MDFEKNYYFSPKWSIGGFSPHFTICLSKTIRVWSCTGIVQSGLFVHSVPIGLGHVAKKTKERLTENVAFRSECSFSTDSESHRAEFFCVSRIFLQRGPKLWRLGAQALAARSASICGYEKQSLVAELELGCCITIPIQL